MGGIKIDSSGKTRGHPYQMSKKCFLMKNPVSNNVDPDQMPHYVAAIWVCTVCL